MKKWRYILLLLLAAGYFCIFILPNQTGAKDATMLGVFEHDEFAQYPHAIHMLQQGESTWQTFRNFLVYDHYYYGYPFYFFSALVLLPFKWINPSGWMNQTQALVLALRQVINVLPMILATILLILPQLKSRNPWKAILLFLLLLSLPAVMENNLWWHPDSLLALFSILTLLFLIRDQGKLGKHFYFSGIACGLAIGTKLLGLLFVLTYISYLLYVRVAQKQSWRKVAGSAALFLLLMCGTFVLSNPLLMLPIERGEILASYKQLFFESDQGFWVINNGLSEKLISVFHLLQNYYGGILLFILALAGLIYRLIKKQDFIRNLVILTWVIGFTSYFAFYASTLRPYYLIPAMLPLYATLLDGIPRIMDWPPKPLSVLWVKKFAGLGLVVLLILITTMNTVKGIETIKETAHREETSGSLALYKAFEEQILPKIPADTPLVIYRDWRAYVPDHAHWRVLYNWDLANYAYIQENEPDILFLERENVTYFSDDTKIAEALDPVLMKQMYRFYSDVQEGSVTGYNLIYQDNFGYILVSKALNDRYFR